MSDLQHLKRTQSPPLWIAGPTASSTILSTSPDRGDESERSQYLHSSFHNKASSVVDTSICLKELLATASAPTARQSTVEHDRSFLARITKWQLLSACLMSFGGGMNNGAPGALIPYLEHDYSIGYAIVSMIFISNALGFIFAAPSTQAIESKLGR